MLTSPRLTGAGTQLDARRDERIAVALMLLGEPSHRRGSWNLVCRPDHTVTLRIVDDELEARRDDVMGRKLTWFDVLPKNAPTEAVLTAVAEALRASTAEAAATAHATHACDVRLDRLLSRLAPGERTPKEIEALAYRCWCDDPFRPRDESFDDSSSRRRGFERATMLELGEVVEEQIHRRGKPAAAIHPHVVGGADRLHQLWNQLRRE